MDLVKKLGLTWPLFQAPMAGVSTPEMAAAVSNAGGLGALGLGAAGVDGARQMLQAARALTERPINANLFCHEPAVRDADVETAWLAALAPTFARYGAEPPQTLHEIYKSFAVDRAMCDMLLEENPGVVSLHFGLPDTGWIAELQAAGNLVFASATNVEEARACQAAGVDAIVAQGIEAGGHRGMFDPEAEDAALSTLALVRALGAEVDVPIIAAGGLMDGADVARALAAGAAVAQLGTAFLDCTESAADAGYRAALRDPALQPSELTPTLSGRPARCLRNKYVALGEALHARVPDYPVAYDVAKQLNAAAKAAGEPGFGAQWAGAGVARVRQGGAAEILQAIGVEYEAAQ
ncbi:NAD(P)H-dependent flavin oxidoreductase [Shimia sp. MMG029]|uniref:NAD(P)H-dependent flavin oxidoreductase n=1 Tax=Shimia sp. MMG029 TaxID=3021978 RepID=UPI0022FE60CF|nr:nitronate monooxygenase [Shimia sp. MMG029]MDA5558817.1 nitronate monooxygenase [Shimia sp. MMG029]